MLFSNYPEHRVAVPVDCIDAPACRGEIIMAAEHRAPQGGSGDTVQLLSENSAGWKSTHCST